MEIPKEPLKIQRDCYYMSSSGHVVLICTSFRNTDTDELIFADSVDRLYRQDGSRILFDKDRQEWSEQSLIVKITPIR